MFPTWHMVQVSSTTKQNWHSFGRAFRAKFQPYHIGQVITGLPNDYEPLFGAISMTFPAVLFSFRLRYFNGLAGEVIYDYADGNCYNISHYIGHRDEIYYEVTQYLV